MRRAGWLAAIAVAATGSVAAQSQTTQTQTVPPVTVTVTVSAEEARSMNRSVASLEGSEDPLLAKLATHLIDLTNALEQPQNADRIFTIGPLTELERASIGLEDYLRTYQSSQGSLHIQVLASWVERKPAVYTFSPGAFLALLAGIAKGPIVQVTALQQNQVLFLGRMILDLNWQAGGVIPDAKIFAALANVFQDKRVGARVVGIVEQMADDGSLYDLVPEDLLEDFRKAVPPGFIVPAATSSGRIVHLTYGEEQYSTRPDDLVWSYCRFFAGDNSKDWSERAVARSHAALGMETLDYLDAQIRSNAIDALCAKLAAAAAGQDVTLGKYFAGGPVLAFLKDAPGITRTTVPAGSEYVTVSVQRKKVKRLTKWLDAARQM